MSTGAPATATPSPSAHSTPTQPGSTWRSRPTFFPTTPPPSQFLDAWGGREHHLIITQDDGCICRHKETMWPVQGQHVEQVQQLAMPFAGDAAAFHKQIEECG